MRGFFEMKQSIVARASRPRNVALRGRDARATGILAMVALLLALTGCGEAKRASNYPLDNAPADSNLNLRIDGPGYFIFKTAAGGFLFSARGQLFVGANGDLVNADGYPLVPRINIAPGTGRLEVLPTGQVQAISSDTNQRLEIGQIRLALFSADTDLTRDGDYVLPTEDDAKPTLASPGQRGSGLLRTNGQ